MTNYGVFTMLNPLLFNSQEIIISFDREKETHLKKKGYLHQAGYAYSHARQSQVHSNNL